MMLFFCRILFSLLSLVTSQSLVQTSAAAALNSLQPPKPVTYYIHPLQGNDNNSGTSSKTPFKSLKAIEHIKLNPGDKILLASGQVYTGSLRLLHQQGTKKNPILITSNNWENSSDQTPALIQFKSEAYGVYLEDCSFVTVSNIRLTGNGYATAQDTATMRCAVFITNNIEPVVTDIQISHVVINEVYYENPGFVRGEAEVKSENGTQRYGWGIRVINLKPGQLIQNILLSDCEIVNVSHTGIRLTGIKKNIRNVKILRNKVRYTGGPGMQMSEVAQVYVANNIVDHSGSKDDSRKWGRGSGLWTWGSTNVLIEKNQFLYANGPGDSNGAHIDFNCSNIVLQYNISYRNAGGFCEILGNNYNCIYRYNISVNDGYRIKGVNGAFQEGKTLWLSGYQGTHQPRKGPVNTFIYNNTIYVDSTIHPKIAFDNTSKDVLIANNIFYVVHPFQLVLGDQYKPDIKSDTLIRNMRIENNLFLQPHSWPAEIAGYDTQAIIGDPLFEVGGGRELRDYFPQNRSLIKNKGIAVASDWLQLKDFPFPVEIKNDIIGQPVPAQPGIGAIEP